MSTLNQDLAFVGLNLTSGDLLLCSQAFKTANGPARLCYDGKKYFLWTARFVQIMSTLEPVQAPVPRPPWSPGPV